MRNCVLITSVILIVALFANSQNLSNSSGYEIVTPKPALSPKINGPAVYGCRPGNPFLYRIPCQGERPIRFKTGKLPNGLILDDETGIISGVAPEKGEYNITIKAGNAKGSDSRSFKIISGDKLALTPPMGYNHWYAHYDRITDKMMREAADIMISSGMADVGYQYVNIDDCWMNAPKNNDPLRVGPLRDEKGNILPNKHFPDMKSLTDYIHAKGLKAGIYTSPGTLTCGGFAGSYQHEEQDAKLFADWGFDFLKYDWCSYGKIATSGSSEDKNITSRNAMDAKLREQKKPYLLMGNILKELNRDIVFNLCQYGMGEVWKWGGEVGGHCWRTAGDLGFELDRVFEVALKNSEYRLYSKPGEWNDPDYLQIGFIGKARGMGIPEMTKMPSTMQYAYMSLWCLMAAPLVYSGDMSRLDEFTLNVLCNPEVIEVNQDPLGEAAEVILIDNQRFIMKKNMSDGSVAIGLFNRSQKPQMINIDLNALKISKSVKVRDVWRHKNLGIFKGTIEIQVPETGVVMVRAFKN